MEDTDGRLRRDERATVVSSRAGVLPVLLLTMCLQHMERELYIRGTYSQWSGAILGAQKHMQ
jgi:hypothetical protein